MILCSRLITCENYVSNQSIMGLIYLIWFLSCSGDANKSAKGTLILDLVSEFSLLAWVPWIQSPTNIICSVWSEQALNTGTTVVHYPVHCDLFFSLNPLVSSRVSVKVFVTYLWFYLFCLPAWSILFINLAVMFKNTFSPSCGMPLWKEE